MKDRNWVVIRVVLRKILELWQRCRGVSQLQEDVKKPDLTLPWFHANILANTVNI